jgi:hypothetical protein
MPFDSGLDQMTIPLIEELMFLLIIQENTLINQKTTSVVIQANCKSMLSSYIKKQNLQVKRTLTW